MLRLYQIIRYLRRPRGSETGEGAGAVLSKPADVIAGSEGAERTGAVAGIEACPQLPKQSKVWRDGRSGVLASQIAADPPDFA